jgi:ATP-binding cassette subfamily F protein 3
MWHLGRLAAGEREQVLRDFLGGFDIRGDMAFQKVASFSGGEKARLALALIVWQRPNLLLLDEPTNHLDIEMREALAEALVDFEGALIVVAHDRHLLASATDQWMLVADGTVAEFEGSLDDYKEFAKQYRARASGQAQQAASPAVSRKDERRAEAQERQRLAGARKPFEKRLAAIEAELAPWRPRPGRPKPGSRLPRPTRRRTATVAGDVEAPRRACEPHRAARGGLALEPGGDGEGGRRSR